MKKFKFHLIRFASLTIIFNFSILNLYSQNLETLRKYADTNQFDKLKDAITNLSEKEKDTDSVLYMRALFEKDADKALAIYNRIIVRESKSITTVRALWRVAQYYYIKGLYIKSSEVLLKIINEFPNSLYAKDAKNQLDIIKDVYGDKIRLSAILPKKTNRPKKKSTEKTVVSSVEPTKIRHGYTLQLGAFGNRNNAQRRVNYLTKSGYNNVRIISKVSLGKRYYCVWLGDFRDKNSAKKYGDDIKLKLKINYAIEELY